MALSLSYLGSTASFAFLIGLVLLRDEYRRKLTQQRPSRAAVDSDKVLEDAEDLRLPKELPPDLVKVCAAGECVLYAGAGLSAQSGLPTWRIFIHGLLEWALANSFISATEAASFHAETDKGQADSVADAVVSRLTTQDQPSLLNSYLRQVFLRRSVPSGYHSQLRRIKFSAVLTTNFDNLLEEVYETSASQVYTPKSAESLLAALTRREFFILKLYGTLDQPDTVMIAPAQYEDAITGNRLFSQFMETLFFSRTILFVGASLEGIEAYLRGISLPKEVARRHYALVAVTERAWRAKADLLERRYGIKVLPYTPSSSYAELGEFLSLLTEAVQARLDVNAPGKRSVSRLKRLSLENIGPFDRLSLDLESKCHILLGDNGVGKSTVLKAIALALCGEKAQPYAGRLLKGRSESARITLETDNKTSYVTTIKRNQETGEAEIISTTARPLEAEGWLAIGFPPLRTTSWAPLKGPDAETKTKSRPVVDDLLPLIHGDVDPRLDKLKQWIVNLDYLGIKGAAQGTNQDDRIRGLIQRLFDLIGTVAEGMTLKYVDVDDRNRIIVKTGDGTEIPLEALSQGVISLIGWIGILMQRLYEVFDQDEDPLQRYALVLMDEIDAHMHPLWQRKLINHLKETFPNTQFIATTHSPLVVGGMSARQVTRFARDNQGKVVILPIEPDMTLGYTDQILTSLLFGLPTTIDDTTERKMDAYYALSQMKDHGGDQQKYEDLKRELMARVPPPAASYEEKREEQLSEVEVLRQLGETLKRRSPEGGQLLIDRAAKLQKIITEGDQGDD
jgi:predicted ATP-binding protein involved in virulence